MEHPYKYGVQTVIDGSEVDDAHMQKEAEMSETEVSDGCTNVNDTHVIQSTLREIHCDPCKYDGSVQDVTGFCVSCTEYLCQSCQRYHKKNKLTRSHNILIDDNIPKDPAAFRTIKEHMDCSRHPGNELRFECVTHKAIICAVCFAQQHRHCVDIVDMETCEEHIPAEVADQQLVTNLKDRLTVCKQMKMKEVEELKKQHEKITQHCNDLVEKWKKHIDNLGIVLMNETDTCSQQELKKAMDCLNECTDMENYLDAHKEIVATLTLYGSRKEVAVVSRSLTEKIGMCEGILNKTDHSKPKKLVLQKISPSTTNSIGSVSVKETVAVDQVPKQTQTESSMPNDKTACMEDSSTIMCEENVLNVSSASIEKELETAFAEDTVRKPFSMKIDKENIRLISTKSSRDKKLCSICAITKLSDGRIVVAEESNKKLKLFSETLILVSEIKLPSVPADICSIGNTVFVCFSDLKRIFRYPVGNAFFGEPGSFATKQSPISLSVFDKNRLIILFKKEGLQTSPLIEVREGNAIKATLTHSDAEEFNGIKEATEVVRYGESCLVMAEKDQISCYRVDKHLVCQERLWMYIKLKKSKLMSPHGLICTSGNIFVCGTNSSNVHCVLWRKKIVSQINNPLCVLVDSCKVVVGCRNDDYLHVYNII